MERDGWSERVWSARQAQTRVGTRSLGLKGYRGFYPTFRPGSVARNLGSRIHCPGRCQVFGKTSCMSPVSCQRSSKTYSCCASRVTNVFFAPEPIVNSKPLAPGATVTKVTVSSGFLREATSLFHSPKSKIVAAPDLLTSISPSDAFE
jgi:hypothetical protein